MRKGNFHAKSSPLSPGYSPSGKGGKAQVRRHVRDPANEIVYRCRIPRGVGRNPVDELCKTYNPRFQPFYNII